uniref:Uncharacterized protein n=1 Tax=Meloidogyne enterolobii TaxID=390850 RepID=A0A6V7U153_MELEN|nr:unnamed protein product [Meloidogyne enterolobii]
MSVIESPGHLLVVLDAYLSLKGFDRLCRKLNGVIEAKEFLKELVSRQSDFFIR